MYFYEMRVFLTKTAKTSIKKIEKYLSSRFSESVKSKYQKELRDTFYLLSRQPMMGRSYKKEYYQFVFSRSIIFYKIEQNKRRIIIMEVLDSRQDYDFKLFM